MKTKAALENHILKLLVLSFVLMTACQNKANIQEDISTQDSISEVQTTSDIYDPQLPEVKFDGADFTFIGTDGSGYGGYYATNDIFVETSDGEPLNDAIYERNRVIEETYEVNIELILSDNIGQEVIKTVNANDIYYDALFGHQSNLYSLASQGYLLNLNNLDYLNLENDWWDKNCIKDYKIKDKNYFITGDISTLDDGCTRLCLFNKTLIKDYQLESPYELIADNQWTFDKFSEMVLSVSHDINGNGIMEPGDISGLITEHSLFNILFFGCEGQYITPENDTYKVTIDNEVNFSKVEKIFNLMLDSSLVPIIENWKTDFNGFSNVYTYARSLFTQDKFLFHITAPLTFTEFREMESDFGILPPPKYSSDQDRYYCYVDPESPMLAIATGTANLEKSGIILEAMAAESKKTVTPIYHETLLKRKYTRDNESAAMLDIIDNSRTYNFILVTNWGNILNIPQNHLTNNQAVNISDFAAIKEKTEAEIAKAMEMFEALE